MLKVTELKIQQANIEITRKVFFSFNDLYEYKSLPLVIKGTIEDVPEDLMTTNIPTAFYKTCFKDRVNEFIKICEKKKGFLFKWVSDVQSFHLWFLELPEDFNFIVDLITHPSFVLIEFCEGSKNKKVKDDGSKINCLIFREWGKKFNQIINNQTNEEIDQILKRLNKTEENI